MSHDELIELMRKRGLASPMQRDEVMALCREIERLTLERAAKLLDDDADRQERVWNEHLRDPRGDAATSFHEIPRGYATRIRALGSKP